MVHSVLFVKLRYQIYQHSTARSHRTLTTTTSTTTAVVVIVITNIIIIIKLLSVMRQRC